MIRQAFENDLRKTLKLIFGFLIDFYLFQENLFATTNATSCCHWYRLSCIEIDHVGFSNIFSCWYYFVAMIY